MGLNHSIPDLYWIWLSHAVRGDLGDSYAAGVPVSTIVAQRFEPTAELILCTLIIASALALLVGVLSAHHASSRAARAVFHLSALGFAVPDFYLATIVVGLFALDIHLFPATGFVPLSQSFVQNIRSLVLPVGTLATIYGAILTRQVQSAMDGTLHMEFVRTERAAGLRERTIVWRHALRVALVPLLNVLPLTIAALIGGTVLVENVMNIPGLGTAIVQAAEERDYPVIQGITLLMVLTVILLNLFVDLLALVVDPRIRKGTLDSGGVVEAS